MDEGLCHSLECHRNAASATEHFQMGPAIMRRDNPKLRTVALTIAIAGVTGLLLNASFLPWIGASQSAAVGLGECS